MASTVTMGSSQAKQAGTFLLPSHVGPAETEGQGAGSRFQGFRSELRKCLCWGSAVLS